MTYSRKEKHVKGNISIWVYIYLIIHALFSASMAAVALIDPSFQFTGLLQTSAVMHPIGLYANRGFAIAAAALYAVFYGIRTRRPSQITSILLIFFLTDLLDFILLAVRGDSSWLMFVTYLILFWIPEVLSLLYLSSRLRIHRRKAD